MSDLVIDRSERLDLAGRSDGPTNAYEASFVEEAERLLVSQVTLELDRPVDPLLVRAYHGGRLRAYAVRDQFGWAIMARVPDRVSPRLSDRGYSWTTVDRYEPFPGEASAEVTRAAVTGLARYAATGRTDEP